MLVNIFRPIGLTIGALAMVGCITGVYSLFVIIFYPILSHNHLLGPTASMMLGAVIQYAGYGLMAIFVFRYFSRLRLFEISVRNDCATFRFNESLDFWVPLIGLLVIVNVVHLKSGKLSLPTITFDIVLFLLFLYRNPNYIRKFVQSEGNIILFLRPFASFSDRTLLSSILNSLPSRTQALFLVPRSQPLLTLDPYSLGIAGFKFLEPNRSAPIALVASDSEWETCVNYLIKRSKVIFIDVTLMTASLEAEVRYLKKLGANDRTVICIENTVALEGSRDHFLKHDYPWFGLVQYQKKMRFGRSLLALLIALFAVFGVTISILADIIIPHWAKILGGCILSFGMLRYWFVVFAKRGVDSRCSRQIVSLIRTSMGYAKNKWSLVFLSVSCLILATFIYPFAHSRHVLAGEAFDISSKVTLIFPSQSMNTSLNTSSDVRALEMSAKWILLPFGSRILVENKKLNKSNVGWFEWFTPYFSEGITIHLKGKAETLFSKDVKNISIAFYLHDLGTISSGKSAPKLLFGLKPVEPQVIGDDLVWIVDTLSVYPTTTMMIMARLLDFGKILLMIGTPVAFVIFGWNTMKQ